MHGVLATVKSEGGAVYGRLSLYQPQRRLDNEEGQSSATGASAIFYMSSETKVLIGSDAKSSVQLLIQRARPHRLDASDEVDVELSADNAGERTVWAESLHRCTNATTEVSILSPSPGAPLRFGSLIGPISDGKSSSASTAMKTFSATKSAPASGSAGYFSLESVEELRTLNEQSAALLRKLDESSGASSPNSANLVEQHVEQLSTEYLQLINAATMNADENTTLKQLKPLLI